MYYQLNLTIAIQVIFIKFSLALTVFHCYPATVSVNCALSWVDSINAC